jgi:hypothetical protein
MKHVGMLAMILLLCFFGTSNVEGQSQEQEPSHAESNKLTGKVFRSDTGESLSNAYIIIVREGDSDTPPEHFDLRTGGNGSYVFSNIPAGRYTVSIYAWFSKLRDVPCQSNSTLKTEDNGSVKVDWQRKSQAFMELVTIKGFSVEAGKGQVKDFDLACK